MLVYEISIYLVIYLIAWIANRLKYNQNPIKKYIAVIISVLIFLILSVFYFVLRLYIHDQLQAASGAQIEQKKFFSISQSVIGALIFYFTINKNPKKPMQLSSDDKIEPRL